MNKTEVIKRVAEVADINQATATKALDALCSVVTECLKDGQEIAFPGLGKFSISERAERKGRNPKTGDEIVIAARNAVKFSPGKDLKDAIN